MRTALIGNQNSGKTSLFNALTAKNERIGNWAGVTVDHKAAIIKKIGIELVDLPGTYSLSPYSPEEKITSDYVFDHSDDLFINVADSNELERSLYLSLQLIENNVDFILVLNMCDLNEKLGINIDADKLSELLHRPVIKISVKKKIGVNKLIDELLKKKNKSRPSYENKIAPVRRGVSSAKERYRLIEKILKECTNNEKTKSRVNDVLDGIFLNKWAAIPLFFLIMTAVFTLSVGAVGNVFSDGIGIVFGAVRNGILTLFKEWKVDPTLSGMVVNGIVAGVSSVLAFLPRLIVLYALLHLLEASGYMARVAFIFDELMSALGLDGKCLIPLILGFGCTVPAAESTKTFDSGAEKRLLLFLLPFVPCSAKLPIIALFADFFFKGRSVWIVATVYLLSVFFIIVSAKIISPFLKKSYDSELVYELPLYKLPSASLLIKDVAAKSFSFIKRVGSVIVLSSVVIWFLSYFGADLRPAGSVANSLLYYLGRGFSFLLYPIIRTNSPSAFIACLSGLIAKEQVVSTMAVIAGVDGAAGVFSAAEFAFFTPASAMSFVVFNVFCPPCINALITLKKEFGGIRPAVYSFLYQTFSAYISAIAVYFVTDLFI